MDSKIIIGIAAVVVIIGAIVLFGGDNTEPIGPDNGTAPADTAPQDGAPTGAGAPPPPPDQGTQPPPPPEGGTQPPPPASGEPVPPPEGEADGEAEMEIEMVE